ncbi:MAG TPA: pilus assembly protein [Myxococcus sp.]|nr:pilus assembly protein [Myxococcus sp.]
MSLLEITVALAVLGLMVGLAVMGIREPISQQREREAVRELWSSALRARQVSLSTNQPVRIVVDSNVAVPGRGTQTVARWERLKCDNDWNNNACPQSSCINTTCRATPACCDATGPDIVIPGTMDASRVHGLCFLPGNGRAVKPTTNPLGCMRGLLDDTAAITAAAPGSVRLSFTSGRARSLLLVEPVTGLVEVLDCDSKSAELNPETACTAP